MEKIDQSLEARLAAHNRERKRLEAIREQHFQAIYKKLENTTLMLETMRQDFCRNKKKFEDELKQIS